MPDWKCYTTPQATLYMTYHGNGMKQNLSIIVKGVALNNLYNW